MSRLPWIETNIYDRFVDPLVAAGLEEDVLVDSVEDVEGLLQFCADFEQWGLMREIVATIPCDRLRHFVAREMRHIRRFDAMAEGLLLRDDVSLTMALAVYVAIGEGLFCPDLDNKWPEDEKRNRDAVGAGLAESLNAGNHTRDERDMEIGWEKFRQDLERFLDSPAQRERGKGSLDPGIIAPAIDAIRHGHTLRKELRVEGRPLTLDDVRSAAGHLHSGSQPSDARGKAILDVFRRFAGKKR